MNCIERSTAVYHTTGAATNLGTVIVVPDPELLGNIWKSLTVVNDTDQDIKITYTTESGYAGAFIVPRSIKGFTKVLKGAYFVNTEFRAISLAVSAATGNITFNFGV
jgi:hypothetical protein